MKRNAISNPISTMDRMAITIDEIVESPAGFGRVEVTHFSLNDDVVEGLRALDYPAFSVQYHPEAAAGPRDAKYLFARFRDMVQNNSHDNKKDAN